MKRPSTNVLVVVDDPSDWPLEIPEIALVAMRDYLTDPLYGNELAHSDSGSGRSLKIFNLCRSHQYQSPGYYVSLLAEARGHKPLPSAGAIEDLQSASLVRYLADDLNAMIQRSLAQVPSESFELGVYFGRSPDSGFDALGHQLFNLLRTPLLTVSFKRQHNHWNLESARAIGAGDLPSTHKEFAIRAAAEYFAGRMQWRNKKPLRFDLAVLYDPEDPEPPSNDEALRKFRKAGEDMGMRVEFITRGHIGRLPEFDALFIRETTFVHHYTYRFSRKALAEGLVVIDEPDSILKCGNKVFLAELLAQHAVPIPETLLVHQDNVDQIIPRIGLPCVLKQPDSSFSRGVIKVETEAELMPAVTSLLTKSALVIAQEWLPTPFDWRVGILDRKILFVAKYHFPAGHWQVIQRDKQQRKLAEGATEAIPLDKTPAEVIRIALKSANLIGDGFYGVDVKQVQDRCCVMEVNENPNVDAGNEDGVLGNALYREIMSTFLARIEARKRGHAG